MKIKIACISDLHGNLIDIPECDLILCAGDIVPLDIQMDLGKSYDWFNKVFTPWKKWEEEKGKKFIACCGNHDFLMEKYPFREEGFLYDEQIEFRGLKIWGTPYQKHFNNWAFNLHDFDLFKKYDLIGPPYGILDYVETVEGGVEKGEHCGDKVLLNILDKLKLKMHVFGHIHFSNGVQTIKNTTFINASICNEGYVPVNKPIILEYKCK